MSKKKTFSGSTMTLKDFHGGSIPSDIPLPSAPGVIVRPADRPSYDRQGSWGNHIGRSDHRLRPNSSGSIRTLDDKTPFLTDTANIGRNFDEDERKPLDGVSRPRRTVSDESLVGPQQPRVESRVDAGRLAGYHQPQGSVSGSQMPAASVGPYAAGVVEGVSRAPLGGGSYHNAWDVRKEVLGVPENNAFSGAGQTSVSKYAQASALEKVSSGRWQTRLIQQPVDVDVIRLPESNLPIRDNSYNHHERIVNDMDSSEPMLARHVQRGLMVDRGTRVGMPRDISSSDRRSPVSVDGRERISGPIIKVAVTDPDEKRENTQSQLPVEASERPKLKLLPRTKPLDATEPPVINHKQISEENHMGLGTDQQGNSNHLISGLTVGEAGDPGMERPKLNLKPRTHPHEQADKFTDIERKAVFGGARPRELVLKGRGVDDIVINNVVQTPMSTHERAKNDVVRTETIQAHPSAQWQSGRAEHLTHDHRSPKNIDRSKDQLGMNTERAVADQKKNWRNENWKNANRGVEKQQNSHLVQHNQEWSQSPETWRKPVQPPKPTQAGVRYGKAVTAAELVQVFSKPVSSEPKPTEQFSSLKGRTPSRGAQAPFSRLMGSTTTTQVNGY